MKDERTDFWDSSISPRNSLDMNPAESTGAVIKEKVEELITSEGRRDRYKYDVFKTNLENTLQDLECDTRLFIDLRCFIRKTFGTLEAAGEVIPGFKILS